MSDCSKDASSSDHDQALHLKLAGIAAILVSSTLGVAIPLLFKNFNRTRLFYIGQCFAAGVILATGFVHILPDAFEALTSPCLAEHPWGKFPFPGFIAMTTAIFVLLIDSLAVGYYTKMASKQNQDHDISESQKHAHGNSDPEDCINVADNKATKGEGLDKFHSCVQEAANLTILDNQTIKNKVIAQVLEFGILAHSVIIGITMGASQSVDTVRPLVGALVFHQLFEGLALGGCISMGGFQNLSKLLMAFFFSITTPVGIAIGIAITSSYNENDPKSLAIQGVFDSMSAGILVYMSLVDLLASQFLSQGFLQNSWTHYSLGYGSVFAGAAAMSVIALWA